MENEKTNSSGVIQMGTGEDNAGSNPIEFKPKTDFEKQKEEKSRRKEKIIGAIGDGLMSLSNLFFTTKGAPNAFGTSSDKGKQNRPTYLTNAILDSHRAQDKEYEGRYKDWEKRQNEIEKANEERKKAEEKNRRIELANDFGIKESNWAQSDFVNQLYGAIYEWNTDPELTSILDSFQYEYEPIWEWMGSNWAHTVGHDKKIDRFKGKEGTYLKRDLIETIFGDDSWTTPENRQHLIEQIIEFENNWVPLK